MQLTGRKRWRLYPMFLPQPWAAHHFKPSPGQLGTPDRRLTLRAGDLLYLPAGFGARDRGTRPCAQASRALTLSVARSACLTRPCLDRGPSRLCTLRLAWSLTQSTPGRDWPTSSSPDAPTRWRYGVQTAAWRGRHSRPFTPAPARQNDAHAAVFAASLSAAVHPPPPRPRAHSEDVGPRLAPTQPEGVPPAGPGPLGRDAAAKARLGEALRESFPPKVGSVRCRTGVCQPDMTLRPGASTATRKRAWRDTPRP